jgi:hypothetical protein
MSCYHEAPISHCCDCRQGQPCDGHMWRHQLRQREHPSVQASLPAWLKALLPVVITHCGAVDKHLLQQLPEDLPGGVPAYQVARRLQQLGRQQRCVLQHAYLSAAAHQQQPSSIAACHSGTQRLLTQVLPSVPPPPPPRLPAVAPNAYYGSAKWLLSVWLTATEGLSRPVSGGQGGECSWQSVSILDARRAPAQQRAHAASGRPFRVVCLEHCQHSAGQHQHPPLC